MLGQERRLVVSIQEKHQNGEPFTPEEQAYFDAQSKETFSKKLNTIIDSAFSAMREGKRTPEQAMRDIKESVEIVAQIADKS